PQLDPTTRRHLGAYADGVNAWMDGRAGGELGFAYTMLGLTGGDDRPDRWSAVDSLAWLKAMAWDLRGNMAAEIERALLSAELPPERVEQLFPDNPSAIEEPILSDDELSAIDADTMVAEDGSEVPLPPDVLADAAPALSSTHAAVTALPALLGTGDGIGSNSWVV